MNRRERRAAGHRGRRVPDQVLIGNPAMLAALNPQCPDCDSEITRWVDDHGINRITVAHDNTCPTWRAMR